MIRINWLLKYVKQRFMEYHVENKRNACKDIFDGFQFKTLLLTKHSTASPPYQKLDAGI